MSLLKFWTYAKFYNGNSANFAILLLIHIYFFEFKDLIFNFCEREFRFALHIKASSVNGLISFALCCGEWMKSKFEVFCKSMVNYGCLVRDMWVKRVMLVTSFLRWKPFVWCYSLSQPFYCIDRLISITFIRLWCKRYM